MKLIKEIVQIVRHRNGVSGAPFYAVRFKIRQDAPGTVFLGIVFDEPEHVAVLNVDYLAGAAGVAFSENSWRGDVYEPELRKAIAEWERVEQARFERKDR